MPIEMETPVLKHPGGSWCARPGRGVETIAAATNRTSHLLMEPSLGCAEVVAVAQDARACPGIVEEIHQMTTRSDGGRTIASPSVHPNAPTKAGRFDGPPIARKLAGACGSTRSLTRRSSGL